MSRMCLQLLNLWVRLEETSSTQVWVWKVLCVSVWASTLSHFVKQIVFSSRKGGTGCFAHSQVELFNEMVFSANGPQHWRDIFAHATGCASLSPGRLRAMASVPDDWCLAHCNAYCNRRSNIALRGLRLGCVSRHGSLQSQDFINDGWDFSTFQHGGWRGFAQISWMCRPPYFCLNHRRQGRKYDGFCRRQIHHQGQHVASRIQFAHQYSIKTCTWRSWALATTRASLN